MKTTLCAALLLLSSALFAADAPVSYAGKWTLDKSQSKNLPPWYERVDSHALEITQDAGSLNVAVTVTSAQHAPDRFDFHYNLDGTPTRTETMIRTPAGPAPVPTTLKAEPQSNGEVVITIDREMKDREGQPMKGTTVERWKLDATGKLLTIERADEMPRGRMESTMVFTRG